VRLTADIVDLAPGGEGVGRSGDRTVFVPFTAPGDRVELEAAAPPAPGAPVHGTLTALLSPGAVRVAPPCPHFGLGVPGLASPPGGLDQACGGCEWLHVGYQAQLTAKARTVREALRRIARLEPGAYQELPILASPAAVRYRSRAKFHLDRQSGRLVFFQRRSHAPVRLTGCHLLTPGLDALRGAAGPAIAAAGLGAVEVTLEWSELEGRGSAFLRLAEAGAVVRSRTRAEALLAALPVLGGVVLGGPDGAAPAVVGDPVLRHARDPLRPEAGSQRSRPDVFMQANRGANALLVEEALALLAPGPDDQVLELFCGAGNFTAPLRARARAVAAVEEAGPALELARADLSAGNVRFYAGDALKLAAALGRERGGSAATGRERGGETAAPGRDRGPDAPRFDLALLDPPREGAKGVGPLLRDLGVVRAVYVSCDPATFARDLGATARAGFRVASVRPVDMFPQTHHVEAVALLVRGT
jgi:23S rRNA (uracil1939-C5)-methyltransferase